MVTKWQHTSNVPEGREVGGGGFCDGSHSLVGPKGNIGGEDWQQGEEAPLTRQHGRRLADGG